MIDVGKRQAQVADLAWLVSQRFGFVDGAEELGKRQRGTKTDRDKPRAQGRCAHAVNPGPACISSRAYGIRPQSATAPRWLMTGLSPIWPCRGSRPGNR